MEEKNRYNMLDVLKYHINTFKKEKQGFILWIYLFNMIVLGVFPIVMVVFPKFVIEVIEEENVRKLVFVVVGFSLLIIILRALIIYFRVSISAIGITGRLSQNKVYNTKFKDVSFEHLEDINFHKERATALTTLQGNMNGFESSIKLVNDILPRFVSIIGFSIILGMFNIYIIPLTIALSYIQYRISLLSKKYALKRNDELQEARRQADYFKKVSNDFSFGKDIRVGQLENELQKRNEIKNNYANKISKEITFFRYRVRLFDLIYILLINGFTYYLIVNAYMNNEISLAVVSMTVWTILAISLDLQSIFKDVATLREDTTYTANFLKFIDKDFCGESWGENNISGEEIKIEFKDVAFAYPSSDVTVLKDFNLTIYANQTLALVGINGAGKSTIIKLLSGFYQVSKGQILVNDKPISSYDEKEYRNILSVVFQDVNIYAASLIENITGFDPTNEEIDRAIKALKDVGLYDKVMEFKNGIHQNLLKVIDDDGTDLSGGEAQKLAIARALYKENCKLLILDEPTSALDAISERAIYNNFRDLTKNKTAIMISHRLASTRFCDKIAFLENGNVKEYGTHEELMNLENGKYKEMFIIQGKYYQDGAKNDL